MSYNLVTYPDPLLKTKSEPITQFSKEELSNLSAEMIEAMAENYGVGLSAIQVGRPIRFMILRTIIDGRTVFLGLANPEVVKTYGQPVLGQEGCLSFPGIFEEVSRPLEIEVRWNNIEGIEYISTFSGLDARCIQHEIDHMNGISFIDKLPDFRRIKIQQRLTDLRKAYARAGR